MTSFLLATLLPAALVFAGEPAVVPQSEDSVLVTYDLHAVLPRWDAGPGWSQSLLEPPVASPNRIKELETIEGSLRYADLAAFELLDLLTQVLGDELRREGRELLIEGDVLSVLAPPGLHEQVRAVLDGLSQALAGTIPLRVDVLSLAEGSELVPAGALGEDEAAKLVAALVARGAQHKSHSLELCAGRTVHLDAYRRVPFLFDYDVEIAQNSMIFAPVMSAIREGTRLVLHGRSASGGVALSVLLMRSELVGKIQTQPLTLKGLLNPPEGGGPEVLTGPGGIQSPEVLSRGLAFDTFLPEGKALAMTLEAHMGAANAREVVLIRRNGGAMRSYVVRPIPRTNRTLIALDAGLFRPGSLQTEAEPWIDEHGALQPSALAKFDGEFSGFLLEWLKARFSIWRRFGPWILIVTDPAWDRDAAAQLDRLVKSVQRSTALFDVGVDLRAQGREANHPVRIHVPLLAGSSAGLVLARGETAVTGFDVEVAQGAAVPDPFVGSVFEGLALSLAFGETSVEASGLAQLFDSPIAQLESGYDLLGPIERPEPRVLRFDERLELSDGRTGPLRIGSGSDRADQPGFALEITVTPIPR
jgi:hypothetical protein